MRDKLSLFLQELQVTREAERQIMDEHLRRNHLRTYRRIRETTNLKTK